MAALDCELACVILCCVFCRGCLLDCVLVCLQLMCFALWRAVVCCVVVTCLCGGNSRCLQQSIMCLSLFDVWECTLKQDKVGVEGPNGGCMRCL